MPAYNSIAQINHEDLFVNELIKKYTTLDFDKIYTFSVGLLYNQADVCMCSPFLQPCCKFSENKDYISRQISENLIT